MFGVGNPHGWPIIVGRIKPETEHYMDKAIYHRKSQRQNVLEITTATEDAHLQAVATIENMAGICKVNAVNIIEANEKKIFHITFDVAADCQSMKKIMQHAPNLAFV
ncbi:unnamed protein product [Rotaria socialis]|uniref:Uncharacterized protein n=1 Tax=Rotaria socialis TaxID=392032 RepID=A0A820PI99_9BILA|nr:unnamed protein product [Rotaria socialis]